MGAAMALKKKRNIGTIRAAAPSRLQAQQAYKGTLASILPERIVRSLAEGFWHSGNASAQLLGLNQVVS